MRWANTAFSRTRSNAFDQCDVESVDAGRAMRVTVAEIPLLTLFGQVPKHNSTRGGIPARTRAECCERR